MFQRIFFVALLAGLCAGLAATIVQMSWSVPLILKAESFENAAPAAAPAPAAHAHDHAVAHTHGAAEWEPGDGFERSVWSVVTNILLGVGGGLLLAGIFALRRTEASWKSGLVWGAGAFVAFALSPAVGLPPELPGTAAADLGARQAWWVFTVIATGSGLAVVAFAPATVWRVSGVALLVLPHVIGAPQPAHHEALAPAALQHEFIAAALVASACFWIVLGGAAGYFAGRFKLSLPPLPAPEAA